MGFMQNFITASLKKWEPDYTFPAVWDIIVRNNLKEEPMIVTAASSAEEMKKKNGKEYLPYIIEQLKCRIGELELSLEEGQKEIEGMHEYYWENYTEMDQYGYEEFDNRQALFQQVNANQENQKLCHRFRKMLDSPFFGRVDFVYEGEEEAECFYIGIGNFARKTGSLPLIYDWRAPVSGLFYDYDKGPASYLAPVGELTGEIVSKWQYKIRKGKMLYEFQSDIKIDDEILKAELGSRGEVQLKNIVRTIQREQNAIIRNTRDRILVIQGAAGSGKTSVALHRIAYLLYHDREHLKSSNILILSPNSVFSDYISHILPELGEENIREMSFDLFAYRQLKDTAADCEDRYDQIERCLRHPRKQESFQMKQSEEFLNQLEAFILCLEDDLMQFRDVEYRGYQKTEAEIIRLFYFKFMEIPLLSRMEAVAEYFIDEVETLRDRDLPPEDREMILEKFQKMYETRDFYVLYNRFLKQEGYRTLPNKPLEKRKIPYEDVYPILYLKYRLQTQKGHSGIKHLVVDEMQDYSRLQYLLLNQMFSCKMTILGDKAQTMEDKEQDVTAFLPQIFGRDTRRIVMNKSYRNTVEIASYANKLAGITEMELFDRHGLPVQERKVSGISEALKEVVKACRLSPDGFETGVVILPSEGQALAAYECLKELLKEQGFDTEHKLSYLDRNSSNFQKGLTVTTFYLAKGLEFDQVFALFPEKDTSPLLKQGKYIAATRALHELYMYELL